VANYNVDIAVALKGAKKLTAFNKEVRTTELQVKGLNQTLKNAAKDQNLLVKSFENLNTVLSSAKANFNAVASGTFKQITAAKQLIATERELNKEISLRNQLLTGAKSAQGIGLAVDPVLKSIQRNQRKRKPIQSTSSGFREFSQDASEILLQGQTSPVGARIDKILANRKKSEKEIQKIRETAGKKREIKEKKLIELRKRSEKLIAQDRERAISARGRIAPNVPTIGSLAGGFGGLFKEGGAFAATGGQRAKGALSNALIGGGFPLLFGQGAIGAAGGGIGGALGGALGGGFGFGLSIAGTALAQQVQQVLDFRKSIRELNKEMQEMGISSNISGSQVRQLGKSLGITKEEAVKALQEFKRFGDDAVLIAKKFGGDFGKFDALTQANTVESALSAIRKINKDLTLEEELRLVLSIQRRGVEATINDVLTDSLDKQKQLDTEGFGQGVGGRKRAKVLDREREQLNQINTENAELINKFTRIKILQDEIRIANEEASFSIQKGLQDVNSEIRRLNSAQFQVIELSKVLGASFQESFKGIIRGTMSVGDAFRNMFMRISDHFLDMAAQMMAAQIQRGFLGLLGNMFGNNFTRSAVSATPALTPDQQVSRFTFMKANGGSVRGGNSYIVGERGPELFSPGVSGTITPNEMLGGSTNIVVNVDASGSAVEGDEEQGRELGRMISVAIQSELIKQKRPGGMLA